MPRKVSPSKWAKADEAMSRISATLLKNLTGYPFTPAKFRAMVDELPASARRSAVAQEVVLLRSAIRALLDLNSTLEEQLTAHPPLRGQLWSHWIQKHMKPSGWKKLAGVRQVCNKYHPLMKEAREETAAKRGTGKSKTIVAAAAAAAASPAAATTGQRQQQHAQAGAANGAAIPEAPLLGQRAGSSSTSNGGSSGTNASNERDTGLTTRTLKNWLLQSRGFARKKLKNQNPDGARVLEVWVHTGSTNSYLAVTPTPPAPVFACAGVGAGAGAGASATTMPGPRKRKINGGGSGGGGGGGAGDDGGGRAATMMLGGQAKQLRTTADDDFFQGVTLVWDAEVTEFLALPDDVLGASGVTAVGDNTTCAGGDDTTCAGGDDTTCALRKLDVDRCYVATPPVGQGGCAGGSGGA